MERGRTAPCCPPRVPAHNPSSSGLVERAERVSLGRVRGDSGSSARVRVAVARAAASASAAARDLARLVLPVECAGCGKVDEVLCTPCRALLHGPAMRCEQFAPRLDRMDERGVLPVWAMASYTGPMRELVIEWKDRGRVELTPALAHAFAAGATEVAPVLRAAALGSVPVLVVPAPSADAARRRRGADLVGQLAEVVAAALTAGGVPASAAPVLRQRRGMRDQVGLGARARGGNAGGQVRWRARARPPVPGQPAFLVDDVLTTGATLAACERALEGAGAVVVGAMTLAITAPPGGFGAGWGAPSAPDRGDGWYVS